MKGDCHHPSLFSTVLTLSLVGIASACGGPGSGSDIRLERVVALGELAGDGALPSYPVVSERFPDGHYFITTPWGYGPELVRVFDSTGTYVRSIGRFGDGPDEYRNPEFVRRVGDRAYIFDTQAGRLTVLGENDSTGESSPWTRRPHTFLSLDDGTFVLSSGSWTPGRTLEHVDGQGTLLAMFGDSVTPDAIRFRIGLLADAIGPGFWSGGGLGRLEFQYWSAPGEPGQRVDLERDWFPESDNPRGATPDSPPTPDVVGFWPDSSGALWIVATVADPDWAEGLDSCQPGEGGLEYCPVLDRRLVFDGVIERVAVGDRQTLLHRRFDEPFYTVPEPWIVAITDENEDGWYQTTLWRVSE